MKWRFVRPMSSRSLCLPPARTHFCTEIARGYGGVSSPMKYGLNGTMPATVKSSVGSCGIRLADGTSRVAALDEEVDEGAVEARRRCVAAARQATARRRVHRPEPIAASPHAVASSPVAHARLVARRAATSSAASLDARRRASAWRDAEAGTPRGRPDQAPAHRPGAARAASGEVRGPARSSARPPTAHERRPVTGPGQRAGSHLTTPSDDGRRRRAVVPACSRRARPASARPRSTRAEPRRLGARPVRAGHDGDQAQRQHRRVRMRRRGRRHASLLSAGR